MAQIGVPLRTGGPDRTPLPAAGQKIAQATGNFYQAAVAIINTMKANTFRQVIIGSRDDALLVQTFFQGVEKLTLDELARGQDVFFRYYGFPKGSQIPSGFYVVKIIRDKQSGKWLAQIRNMQGQVVREAAVNVTLSQPVSRTQLFMSMGPSSLTLNGGYNGDLSSQIAVGDPGAPGDSPCGCPAGCHCSK